ncbi:hypothetical protein HU200_041143 [Digitaria exilis]|uniref:Uncharacterized protein n=1 Tax=Digitaria exilis TaxID=1010633 RepID=A0A835BG89_9POAL|nr:hypothetical protein HU200_041143 [Digitaria exilis]
MANDRYFSDDGWVGSLSPPHLMHDFALSYQVYQKIFPVHHVVFPNGYGRLAWSERPPLTFVLPFRHSMAKCSSGCVGGTVAAQPLPENHCMLAENSKIKDYWRSTCAPPRGFRFHTHPVLYITKGWASHATSNFSSMEAIQSIEWNKVGTTRQISLGRLAGRSRAAYSFNST